MRAGPGPDHVEALVAGPELVYDEVPLLMSKLEEPRHGRLLDLGVDGGHRLEPLVVLELADRLAVECDREPETDRLRVDEEPARDESRVDASQSVDDALRLEASERPAAERHVEGLARDVERLGAVHAEANALRLGSCPRRLHALGVRVEGVHGRSSSCCKSGQSSIAAADLENARAFQRNERVDPLRLCLVQVGDVHA